MVPSEPSHIPSCFRSMAETLPRNSGSRWDKSRSSTENISARFGRCSGGAGRRSEISCCPRRISPRRSPSVTGFSVWFWSFHVRSPKEISRWLTPVGYQGGRILGSNEQLPLPSRAGTAASRSWRRGGESVFLTISAVPLAVDTPLRRRNSPWGSRMCGPYTGYDSGLGSRLEDDALSDSDARR